MSNRANGRDAVNRFIDAVKEGGIPRLEDMQQIAAALEEILKNNTKPKDALGINQGRGRPGGKSAFKKLVAIHEVRYMRSEKNKLLEDALPAVAHKYSVAPGTMRNWFENSKSKACAEFCEGPLALYAALMTGAKLMAGEASALEFWDRHAWLDQKDKDHPGMLLLCAAARYRQWAEENPGETNYPVPEGDEALFGNLIRAKHN